MTKAARLATFETYQSVWLSNISPTERQRRLEASVVEDCVWSGRIGDASDAGCRVNALVTDVGLPGGLNGQQVADAARLEKPGLHVLFITAYAVFAQPG